MRFLSMYKSVERDTPPTQDEMIAMGKLVEGQLVGMLHERRKARGDCVGQFVFAGVCKFA